MSKISKTDADWKTQLTSEQFHVTRQQGTERAFSHTYHAQKQPGTYRCICCGEPLFSSTTKYDSGTGWPSFYAPMTPEAVSEHDDKGLFSRRTEIRCSACAAHLGHVFSDGPKPTGLRYCMNGTALKFDPEAK